MKNWKDKDKFTAQDYVNERDNIVNQIDEIRIQAQEIEGEKLILSARPPDVEYDDFIWLDPQEIYIESQVLPNANFNYQSQIVSDGFIKRSSGLSGSLTYTSRLTTGYYEIEERQLGDIAINYISDIISHKMPQFDIPFTVEINYASEIEGYANPFLSRSFEVSVPYESLLTGNAQTILERDFNASVNYDGSIVSHKMPQFDSDFSSAFNYTSNLSGNSRTVLEGSFDAEQTYLSQITSNPKMVASSAFSDALSYESELSGSIQFNLFARVAGGPNLVMQVSFQGETAYSTTVQITETLIRTLQEPKLVTITAPSSVVQGPIVYDFNRWYVEQTGQTETNRSILYNVEGETNLVAYYDEFYVGG